MIEPDDAEPLDVIAVGAHPDDVEIACGGTLAKFAADGLRVGIIDLTDGEPTPRSPSPEVRLAEADAAAHVLGATARIQLDLPNRRLFDGLESRVALATQFRRYRPRLVLGFGDKTPYASPDHWQAMQITDAAIDIAESEPARESFDGLPPHAVAEHVYYTLTFLQLHPVMGPAHFVVDVSSTLDTKLTAIRCYQTQFPPEREDVFRRVRAQAVAHGLTAGYAAGELFCRAGRSLGGDGIIGSA